MFPSTARAAAISILTGIALSVVLIQPVLGYTLLRNNFPNNPVGCTNQSPYWCIEWPLAPDGFSSTTYVYLFSSLNSHPAGETVDMKQQARNAFSRWNDVAARSPYLVEVNSTVNSSGYQQFGCPTSIRRGPLSLAYYAVTTDLTPNDLTGAGSNKKIVCSQILVNDEIAFDSDADPSDGKADARFMFTHEEGHMLGLGHTWHVAVMYPAWPNDVYMGKDPTSDDVLGLQVAYGAP